MATGTNNPPGSDHPLDLRADAKNLDLLLLAPNDSYPDRLGVQKRSWAGINSAYDAAEANRDALFQAKLENTGYELPSFPYAAGISIVRETQLIERLGEFYRAKAGIVPFVTTGVWATDELNLVAVGDAVLRQELAGPGGSALIGTIGSGAGSIQRDLQEKAREYITIGDKGGVGDGVFNNAAALNAALADRINGWSMVRFTPGTWLIGSQIRLRAKTVIVIEPGAELVHGATGQEMLFINGEAGNATYATGYDGDGDIYIFGLGGGTVNINASSGFKGMARFGHAKNIWISGLKIKNGYRAHNVEFNACNNFICENCEFTDHLSPVGETNFETVQIDHAASGAIPEFGAYDDTPSINGWVRNNRFNNVWSAFGSHSDPNPAVGMHDNIHFVDNVINGFRGMPFKLQGFTNSSALRNVMTGAGSSARGPVIWSSRNIDAGFGELDMSGAAAIGWTVGNSSLTYFSEDVDIHDTLVRNATNNPIFYTNCTRGNVLNNILANCAKSIFMSTAFDINVIGNRHDGGTAPYLVEIASTSLRISVTKNTGTFVTARYNTISFLTETDGETLISPIGSVTSGTITLTASVNDFVKLVIGTGSISGGTFRSQYSRGFTSVGFAVNDKIVVPTASGSITLNVDSLTSLTVTAFSGTEGIRFIYGERRRS